MPPYTFTKKQAEFPARHVRHTPILPGLSPVESLPILASGLLAMPEVAVMVARGWSDEDRRLYTLADNRLAETL